MDPDPDFLSRGQMMARLRRWKSGLQDVYKQCEYWCEDGPESFHYPDWHCIQLTLLCCRVTKEFLNLVRSDFIEGRQTVHVL